MWRPSRRARWREALEEAPGRRNVDVRSDRQDRARHRRHRRHRRGHCPRVPRAGRHRRRLRHPARGARCARRRAQGPRPRAALQSRRQGRGRGAGAEIRGGHGQARHPGGQCRHHPRQSVRAAQRRGLGRGARGQLDRHVSAGAGGRARDDAPAFRPDHRHHLGGRRHRQPGADQLHRDQGRHDRHDQVDRRRNTPSAT